MREVLISDDRFELPLIQSAVLPVGFRHGFTTRAGGVSQAPFDTLNLGGKWGDGGVDVAENRRRVEIAAGGRRIFFATQVHGAHSVCVAPGDTPETVILARADALIATAPATAIGVYVADCVPALIADTRTGICAAVHAGWRGTVAGVLSATLRRMVTEFGTNIADVRIAIGPSIGPCCFEVGPEVVAAVEVKFPGARAADAIVERAPRAHVDLWLLNRLDAQSVGVPPDAIDVAALCTSCDTARFFSYRRDRGRTGQLAAFIVHEHDHDPRSTIP
jgi:polyphenol oxidase